MNQEIFAPKGSGNYYAMPGLFHLPAIGFGQAVALLVIARLLFGRIGHGRHRRHWLGGRHGRAASQECYERWWRGRNDPPAPGAAEPQA